jgi:hypothetical protein
MITHIVYHIPGVKVGTLGLGQSVRMDDDHSGKIVAFLPGGIIECSCVEDGHLHRISMRELIIASGLHLSESQRQ